MYLRGKAVTYQLQPWAIDLDCTAWEERFHVENDTHLARLEIKLGYFHSPLVSLRRNRPECWSSVFLHSTRGSGWRRGSRQWPRFSSYYTIQGPLFFLEVGGWGFGREGGEIAMILVFRV